jgi:hypothetical protein
MEQMVEIPDRLAEAMGTLAEQSTNRHNLAVVVPLRDGMREVAAEFLAEGPPFSPKEIGIVSHRVFLTDAEVVFVFETEGELSALDRILAEPEFWSMVSAWEHLSSGQPRVGTAAFEWST